MAAWSRLCVCHRSKRLLAQSEGQHQIHHLEAKKLALSTRTLRPAIRITVSVLHVLPLAVDFCCYFSHKCKYVAKLGVATLVSFVTATATVTVTATATATVLLCYCYSYIYCYCYCY